VLNCFNSSPVLVFSSVRSALLDSCDDEDLLREAMGLLSRLWHMGRTEWLGVIMESLQRVGSTISHGLTLQMR
jgi:hypothetical protein